MALNYYNLHFASSHVLTFTFAYYISLFFHYLKFYDPLAVQNFHLVDVFYLCNLCWYCARKTSLLFSSAKQNINNYFCISISIKLFDAV